MQGSAGQGRGQGRAGQPEQGQDGGPEQPKPGRGRLGTGPRRADTGGDGPGRPSRDGPFAIWRFPKSAKVAKSPNVGHFGAFGGGQKWPKITKICHLAISQIRKSSQNCLKITKICNLANSKISKICQNCLLWEETPDFWLFGKV